MGGMGCMGIDAITSRDIVAFLESKAHFCGID
jgi:hypothetical protein